MTATLNWNSLFDEYRASWKRCPTGWKRGSGHPTTYMGNTFHPTAETLRVLGAPTPDDAIWLIEGLTDERKPFVTTLFMWAPAVAEIFFVPLLNAGIDELEPSGCGPFVRACSGEFGAERVREYLYSVIESGTDDQKAGAAMCLYWSKMHSFGVARRRKDAPPKDEPPDLRRRRRELLARTFLSSEHRDLRVAILCRLWFAPSELAGEQGPFLQQVIDSARRSPDEHIRWLIEYRLAVASGDPELQNRVGAERPNSRRPT